jgi:hypothetical protein
MAVSVMHFSTQQMYETVNKHTLSSFDFVGMLNVPSWGIVNQHDKQKGFIAD